jgi:hypothetical protein
VLYGLPPRYTGPAAVAQKYFAAVTRHDPEGLRSLFAPGAVLEANGKTLSGPDEIARFYADGAFMSDDLVPHPWELNVEGARVVVDLEFHLDGTKIPIRDTFTMAGDKILRLEIELLDLGRMDSSGPGDPGGAAFSGTGGAGGAAFSGAGAG